MKKVLLSTVCAPFGANTDDCTEHVMPELFHAQVTRSQGIFSPRVTYIAYGLEYIANNIQTPATVLQYPTLKQFERELKKGYDFVGFNFVIATFEKLKKMVQVVRDVSPDSKIILGGYGTMLPECEEYGDYICREEGVGFMRRILGEQHDGSPHKHVVYPTRGRVAGFPAMKGAVVMAGLGCPHGCEFCATSHFHKRRHIPLLKTGADLHREIRRIHRTLKDHQLPVGIIEEDFLMQRKRAQEYLDCVKKDPENPIKISCFASALAISKWDPEDLVRMGIEAIWVGVESKEAAYSKLKGIDVKEIFDRLHSHGINTLASLILGHDFHTVDKVWDDFEYLMSLSPSLSQFLVLTPACSTPLFERLGKEGRLLDVPCTHWDGFHLVFDHPAISKPDMEQLILDVYDEEYRRLGPSVIRYIDRQLAGYRRFHNSPDPLLQARAEQFRQECLSALPLFPTAVRHAPTPEVGRRIAALQRSVIDEIGSGGLKNKILSSVVPLFAGIEKFKLKHCGYPQARLQRTEYRMTPDRKPATSLDTGDLFTIKPRCTEEQPLVVDIHGVFNRLTASRLKERIDMHLQQGTGPLALNFMGAVQVEREVLLGFLEKLRDCKERIKIVSIDSLQAEMDDVVSYARTYFEVFTNVEVLSASLATAP
ncbi:B12-binding domain-containing radical SAM protein [Thermodesulfobacteriota bacterium]